MQPLGDLPPRLRGRAAELAGLGGEILQDRARLHQADACLVISDGRDLPVGRDTEELRLMLFARADVHPADLVVEAHFLERDCDLVSVGRSPEICGDHSALAFSL